MNWIKNNIFPKKLKTVVSERADGIYVIKEYSDGSFSMTMNQEAGSVDGIHYTGYIEKVKELKREKRYNDAIELLLKLIDATEREAKFVGNGWRTPPGWSLQLAVVYRKEKRYDDEVSILERYEKFQGLADDRVDERLVKARALAKKMREK